MASIKFTDHSSEIIEQINRNVKVALTAVGLKGVELTTEKMLSGYGRPIRKTGDLLRNVKCAVENSGENTVDVGNDLEYAPFVHDGTYKMAGRPYLRDALMDGKEKITEIAEAYMKQGL